MDLRKLMGAIEAILFVSGEPVGIDEIAKTLNISKEVVLNCFNIMKKDYESDSRGIMISMVGEKLLLKTKPNFFSYIEKLFKPKVSSQLSKAALETLAIIMFKQPITRTEIEDIRGVNVEKALKSLQEKKLICEKGRLQSPGRPILFITTDECLDYFGLESIDEVNFYRDK
ncbi:MAG TPA: SMC-Scp complex subunit ScpB [Thermoanaerobacterales bacterium]|jgi:segregation and condensation protein B|nr:SMC-Scp complex subunit ScpB [Thermoanaerobacterales bacterium]